MSSPPLSSGTAAVPLGTGSLPGQDQRHSAVHSDDSARMMGLATDSVPDTLAQIPSPPPTRFQKIRGMIERKIATVKNHIESTRARNRTPSLNQNQKIFTISRSAIPHDPPDDKRRHSEDAGFDSTTEKTPLITHQSYGSDTVATHANQTSAVITNFERRILETGNSEAEASVVESEPATAQESPANIETASGPDTESTALQTGIPETTNTDLTGVSSNPEDVDVPVTKSISDPLIMPDRDDSTSSPSRSDTPEKTCLEKEPGTCSDEESALEDQKTEKQVNHSPATGIAVMPSPSRKQLDSTSASYAGRCSITDTAAGSVTVENTGEETPVNCSSDTLASLPLARKMRTDANAVHSRPAVAVAVAAGEDAITDQLPGNHTDGDDSSNGCGATLWKHFKNTMSALGRLISGLIDKLLAVFMCAETSKDDGSSGYDPVSSFPVSPTNTGSRIQPPVQGGVFSQDHTRPGKERTDEAETNPEHPVSAEPPPPLDNRNHPVHQQDESDELHAISQDSRVISSNSSAPGVVIPENTSRDGSDSGPCAPPEMADEAEMNLMDSNNSVGGNGGNGLDFLQEMVVNHQTQSELDQQRESSGSSSDISIYQSCSDEPASVLHSLPDDNKQAPDLTGNKSAGALEASPHCPVTPPSEQGGNDTTAECCDTRTVPDGLRNCKSPTQVNQFIHQQGEKHAALLSATTNKVKAFLADFMNLGDHIISMQTLSMIKKKKYAKQHIKPAIIKTNQQCRELQESCNQLFRLLNITSNTDKDIVVESLLDTAFASQNEVSAQKTKGSKSMAETLEFFVTYLTGYKTRQSLDDSQLVNMTITVKDVLGGAMGSVGALMLSDFPSLTLALDCTYGTLLKVLGEQRDIKSGDRNVRS